jgi:hypothetical protein
LKKRSQITLFGGKSHTAQHNKKITILYRDHVNVYHTVIYFIVHPSPSTTHNRIINIPQFTKIYLFYNFHFIPFSFRCCRLINEHQARGTKYKCITDTPNDTLFVNISTLAARQALNVFYRLLLAFIFHSIKAFREHVFRLRTKCVGWFLYYDGKDENESEDKVSRNESEVSSRMKMKSTAHVQRQNDCDRQKAKEEA